jgi:hypothetical protein
MTRAAARRTNAAADVALAWLDRQTAATVGTPDTAADVASAAAATVSGPLGEDLTLAQEARHVAPANSVTGPAPEAARPALDLGEKSASGRAAAMAPVHTDWLFHQLDINGPADDLRTFQTTAGGAGTIPWHLDLDRMQEDIFLRLVAPPPPQQRTINIAGARILAEELRIAVARRHEIAVACIGVSQACLLDLHALLPVPMDILRLGPDHPEALAWLWAHWGTTQALRHVAAPVRCQAAHGCSPASGEARLHLSFWSADWTPWRVLAQLRARWPLLRFEMRPSYGGP